MSRRNIIPILLLLVSTYDQAQTPPLHPVVSNCFGGSNKEEFFGGSLCLDGGYFLTGLSFSRDGDINPQSAHDSANIFLVRTAPDGAKIWARTFGGNLYDKARFGIQDANGDFLATGTTESNDGDITGSLGNPDLFVLKTDANGNLLWFKSYGGTGYESGRHIFQTSDGGYMVSGYTSSKNFDVSVNRGQHDGWLLKLDVNGIVEWSYTYGGSGVDRIRSVIQTSDGGFAFAGHSASNDLQCLQNHGGSDFWVGRTDATGNLLWSNLFGGSSEEMSYNIEPASNGDFLITGFTTSTDGDITTSLGGVDAWVIRVDASGNMVWQQNLGGSLEDRLYRTIELPGGDLISAGYSTSHDHDLTEDRTGQSASFWLVRHNGSGTTIWSYVTGGSLGDFANDLVYDPSDSSFTLMGDTRSNNYDVTGNHGDFDFWLVKLGLLLPPENPENNSAWSAYYASDTEVIHLYAPEESFISVDVFDMTGKRIGSLAGIPASKGLNDIRVSSLGILSGGIYQVIISGPAVNLNMKIFAD